MTAVLEGPTAAATLHWKGNDYTTSIMEITPGLATLWLQKNIRNRPLSDSLVAQYQRDMKAGHWSLTTEPIIFDCDGNLSNGQHRLMAAVRSGCSFDTWVNWGAQPASMKDVDMGKKRTLGDELAIEGVANATLKAAVAQHIWRWECGQSQSTNSRHPTRSEVADVLARHDIDSSVKWKPGARGAGYRSTALAVFIHYRLARIDRDAADVFFEYLYSGAGLRENDPILKLRNRLINRAFHLTPREMEMLTYKAWNAWRRGSAVKVLKWSENLDGTEPITPI